jgi:hypothetical protein
MKRTREPRQAPSGTYAPRRGRASPAGQDVLSQAAPALQRAGFSDATLVLRWREIAGADIARIAEPVRLTEDPEGAVLTLKCEPGAAVFLQHQMRELLERLATYLGPSRVARLRLVPGELEQMPSPPDHPAVRPGAGSPGPQEPSNPPTLSHAIERLERRRRGTKPKTR